MLDKLKMDISICLVNFNAKELTNRCIESVVEKTQAAYEIILVDNNSCDGSAAEIKAEFPAVTIVNNQLNVGFGRANNQCLKITSGKYLLLLNNDTELKNDALTVMTRFLDDHPNVGILTCKLFESDGKTQKNCRSFPITPFDTIFGRASLLSKLFPNNPVTLRTTLSDWDYNSARRVDWVSGAALMIRREVIDQIGGLDENFFMYWEDTDYCKRASDAGWEVWYTPDGEIIHYTGQGGGKRSLKMRLYTTCQMHRSAYYYFRKHYYKSPFQPMVILTFLGMITLVVFKSAHMIVKAAISGLL